MITAFIGFGKMGAALALGAINAGVLKPFQILAYDPNPAVQKNYRSLKIKSAPTIRAAVQKAGIIFICVKPQQMSGVLLELKKEGRALRTKCFISIAAGVSIKTLERGLGNHVPVIRVMPNTPALLNAGMSAMSRGRHASQENMKWAAQFLGAAGDVVVLNERWMDAVTAVSGSGPAYAFYLAEGMLEGAKRLGLPSSVARVLVHQTLFGAGQMLKICKEDAAELRRQVTSPGGTTEAAMKEFDKKNLKKLIAGAVVKASERSKQLSKI